MPFGVALALLSFACHSPLPPREPLTGAALGLAVEDDTRVLEELEDHASGWRSDVLALQSSGGWKERGYFDSGESDRIELLLFRFHTSHHQLAEISERYRGVGGRGTDGRQSADAVEGRATRLAHQQSQFLVDTFRGDPVAVTQLNQSYPRSEIPKNSYDRVAESLDAKVVGGALAARDGIRSASGAVVYSAQSELFYRVSRLKAPNAHTIAFSNTQKGEVLAALQPGDLVFTYTAGYASDVFIPGAFKHGITFVGTVDQRQELGLSPGAIRLVGGAAEEKKLAADLDQPTTRHGRTANLIEAVAEGVKFSNLEFIMDTHVNRMLVLRPRLSERARRQQLLGVFSYLGEAYDFRFDFADSSRQVCTEVIYRSLDGLEGIAFPLTKRGGHMTLSADDAINYWLDANPDAFEFVLYAEEAPVETGNGARILVGDAGRQRLERLMASGGKG